MSKVIFLDIDGPMLPMRAYITTSDIETVWSAWDPLACAAINVLLRKSGAKLVISSTWRFLGYRQMCENLESNGISPNCLHEDWATPRIDEKEFTRASEIQMWLDKHPEIINWCAFDDEYPPKHSPLWTNWIQVTIENGILLEHVDQAKILLGIPPSLIHQQGAF